MSSICSLTANPADFLLLCSDNGDWPENEDLTTADNGIEDSYDTITYVNYGPYYSVGELKRFFG